MGDFLFFSVVDPFSFVLDTLFLLDCLSLSPPEALLEEEILSLTDVLVRVDEVAASSWPFDGSMEFDTLDLFRKERRGFGEDDMADTPLKLVDRVEMNRNRSLGKR